MQKWSSVILLSACLIACSGNNDLNSLNIEDKPNKPNILIIVADDIGFTDIGSFGSEINTPNLDRLALEGVRLNNLHANSSCQPMRAMLMTGMSPNSVIQNAPRLPRSGERGNWIKLEVPMLQEMFKHEGYSTYMTGKWDLGPLPGYTPISRGFDRYFTQLNGSANYFPAPLLSEDAMYEEDGVSLDFKDLPEDFYATKHYTDKMIEYLESHNQDSPWFAFVPYTAPHWPLMLPEDWLDRYKGQYEEGYDVLRKERFNKANELGVLPKNSSLDSYKPTATLWNDLSMDEKMKLSRAQEIFSGMVEYMDMSIGRIIQTLESTNQLEDTIIIYTADHGASRADYALSTNLNPYDSKNLGGPRIPWDKINNNIENFGYSDSFIDRGLGFATAATAPFKGSKSFLDEGGLRAAAFIRYPKEIKGGEVDSTFLTMMDFFPTFIDITDSNFLSEEDYQALKGDSFWKYITKQTSSFRDEDFSAGWIRGNDAPAEGQNNFGGALIKGKYKIINMPQERLGSFTEWRLYNLNEDPGEHNDLASENPDIVNDLVNTLQSDWP